MLGNIGEPISGGVQLECAIGVSALFYDTTKLHADLLRRRAAVTVWTGLWNERDAALLSGWTGGAPTPGQVEAFVTHLEAVAAPKRQAYLRNPYRKRARGRATPPEAAAQTVAAPPLAPKPEPPVTFGAVAQQLWAHGYAPVPLRPGDKAPILTGWQCPLEVTTAVTRQYAGCGCGLLTAITPTVDVDVRAAAAVTDLRVLACEMLGVTPLLRTGRPPKFAALYRTDQPFPKVVGRQFVLAGDDPEADGYQPHRVEVLGNGQQVVAYGVHPETGAPYSWLDADPLRVPLADLPAIDHRQAGAFVDAAESLLIEHHGAVPVRMRQRAWCIDDRPRGQHRVCDPVNWWWLHAIPFEHLVDTLGLGTEGEHVLGGKRKRWRQRSLAMRCPNHKGAHGNSLNFAQASDGTILFHCFAGCDPEDVAEAISELCKVQLEADLAGLALLLELSP
jgi:hypothetical protein